MVMVYGLRMAAPFLSQVGRINGALRGQKRVTEEKELEAGINGDTHTHTQTQLFVQADRELPYSVSGIY